MLNTYVMQNLHHKLFHQASRVLALAQNDSKEILQPFLQWAEMNNLSMNWATHVHLLNWLCAQEKWRAQIDVAMVKELLIAAVTRWSLSGLDHLHAQGMMVASMQLPGIAAGIWKSTSAEQPARVVFNRLADICFPSKDSYAISLVSGKWESLQWLALPK